MHNRETIRNLRRIAVPVMMIGDDQINAALGRDFRWLNSR